MRFHPAQEMQFTRLLPDPRIQLIPHLQGMERHYSHFALRNRQNSHASIPTIIASETG